MKPTPPKILIVDDEPVLRSHLAEFLAGEGFHVRAVATGEDALDLVADTLFDVVLCDIQLPGLDGLDLLDHLSRISPETAAILITAYATVESAVAAFQRGACDYLMKPVILDEVLAKVRRLIELRQLVRENQDLRRELNRLELCDDHRIIGSGPAMQHVFDLLRKVAPTRSTVLILGESGTGKELVARALHRQGPAPGSRFLAVNCAAIPAELLESQLFGRRKGAFTGADRDQAGVFSHAGDGTVFLDEIGELPVAMQAKLLRAIEHKEVLPVGANEPVRAEARVVAATNKDLKKEVDAGRFREDLYYRLNVVTIEVPPLRERREDIPELVDYLLARHAKTIGRRFIGVTHEAMRLLRGGPWRGNVRELDNALQRAVILGEGPWIGPHDLPPDLFPAADDPGLTDDLGEAVRRFERLHIERVLAQTPDKKDAAKRLNVGLSSLYRKISELGIATD